MWWGFPRGPAATQKTGCAPTRAASPSFPCTTAETPASSTLTPRSRVFGARRSASNTLSPAPPGRIVEQESAPNRPQHVALTSDFRKIRSFCRAQKQLPNARAGLRSHALPCFGSPARARCRPSVRQFRRAVKLERCPASSTHPFSELPSLARRTLCPGRPDELNGRRGRGLPLRGAFLPAGIA